MTDLVVQPTLDPWPRAYAAAGMGGVSLGASLLPLALGWIPYLAALLVLAAIATALVTVGIWLWVPKPRPSMAHLGLGLAGVSLVWCGVQIALVVRFILSFPI